MNFEIDPGAGSGPTPVAAGLGPLKALTSLSAVDPVTGRNLMFLRVVQIREDDGRLGPLPSIRLTSGPDDPTKLDAGGGPVIIRSGGVVVAVATLRTEGDDQDNGIQLVELEVVKADAQWQFQVENNDLVTRRYALVVGSTRRDTRRPILDVVTGALTFDAFTGETTAAKECTLANYGPGDLTIADQDGADLGSGFRLQSLAPRPIPGNGRAVARIEYTAQPTPGTFAARHDFASDDAAADSVVGHSNQLALSAIVKDRALWDLGDVLLVVKQAERYDLHRLDRGGSNSSLLLTDVGGAGIAIDPTNRDVVVVDQGGVVRRIAGATGDRTVQHFGSTGGKLTGPVVRSDGTVFVYEDFESSPVSGPRNGVLWQVDRGGGASQLSMSHFGDYWDRVGRIMFAPNGDFFVLVGSRRLIRVSPSSGTSTWAQFEVYPSLTVVMMTGAGGSSVVYSTLGYGGGGGGVSPFAIRSLGRTDVNTGVKTEICSLSNDVRDLAVGSDGAVIVADSSGLLEVRPGGEKVPLAQVDDVVGITVVSTIIA